MSDKLTCNSGNISMSKPSSLRGTSTPIGPTRLSFSRLDESLGKFDVTQEDTPKPNPSAVPIFGRKNVELAEQRRNNGKKSRIDGISTIQKACQPLANVEKTFDDHSSKIQPGSSSSTRTNQRKGIVRKILGNKRRSTHNESRGPIFQVTPKLPKSPRLLTAIRAKLRANRDKERKMHAAEMMEGSEKKSTLKKSVRTSASRNIISPIFNKYRITIPKSPKLRTKKLKLASQKKL